MNYISLGYFCSIAMELEKIGLRSESSPFDWVISDFEGIMCAIQENFKDFLNYDYLIQNKKNHAIYKNNKYGIVFYHDFDKYKSLAEQIKDVKMKYDRRINRFLVSITKPTTFIRYISDESKINGKSKELQFIESNYKKIISFIRSFNKKNSIIFIANEGVTSDIIKIYNVEKTKNDSVSRSPLHSNYELYKILKNVPFDNRVDNIKRYKKKSRLKNCLLYKVKRKFLSLVKKCFKKEYCHNLQY